MKLHLFKLRLDPTFDTETIDCIDVVPVSNNGKISMCKIKTSCDDSDSISKVLNHIYPDAQPSRMLDELNRIIRLDESAESDEIFVRGLIQAVDERAERESKVFKNDSKKTLLNGEWFLVEEFIDKVLEYTLTKDIETKKIVQMHITMNFT